MKNLWIAVVSVLVMFLITTPLYGQIKGAPVPFAADWTYYEDGERQESGKYYASGEGFRFEGMSGGVSFVWIYNIKRNVLWYLIESERMYVEESADDSDDLGLDDVGQFGSPCPPDARTTRSGSETVNGRRTEKWICEGAELDTITVWYDPKLQTPIRSENEDGRFELINIKEGRQPASLFVPPSGYSKADIPGFGMPTGSSPGGQQQGSMEEMMRSMMQEVEAEEAKGSRQSGSDDATEGMMESLRGLFGR